jgi:hypothetical protein
MPRPSLDRPTPAIRLARVAVAAALALAQLAVAGAAAPVRAAEVGELSATTEGRVGCSEESMWRNSCKTLGTTSPRGVSSWQDDESRDAQASGFDFVDHGHIKLSFEQATGPNGAFQSLSIKGTADATTNGGGYVELKGETVAIFETTAPTLTVSGTATWAGQGSQLISAGGAAHVEVDCESEPLLLDLGANGGAGDPPASGTQDLGRTVAVSGGGCSVNVVISANAASNQSGHQESGAGTMSLDLTLSTGAPAPSPSPSGGCQGIAGEVLDGHGDDLASVQVQLYDGPVPTGAVVPTAADGRYCLPLDASAIDDDLFRVRATLTEADHSPPLFSTYHKGSENPTFADVSVRREDVGRSDVDVDFRGTAEEPWRADVAAIHYQTERYVGWLLDRLGLPATLVGGFKMVTFNGATTSSHYLRPGTIEIAAVKSPYARRDDPTDNGPENAEWHELTHYLEERLGIASQDSAPCIADTVNHGGWNNPNTCDSLNEGFAAFLPTLASLDLDANLGPGYATPDYAGLANLESNELLPWTTFESRGRVEGDEDMATAQLLWDLADDTPSEDPNLWSWDAAAGTARLAAGNPETVALGIHLVKLMIESQVRTVGDLQTVLAASPEVPHELQVPSIDLDGDGVPDLSAIDAEFVLHNFIPVHDAQDPAFFPGDPAGRTDHVPAAAVGLVPRSEIEELAGSTVRLVNTGAGRATFTIDVHYPTTTSHLEVPVDPGETRDVPLRIPPYWTTASTIDLSSATSLPPCDANPRSPVTITIAGAGSAPVTLDACGYWKAIAGAADDGAAITVNGAGTEAVPSSESPSASGTAPDPASVAGAASTVALPVPVLVGGILAVALLALTIGFLVIRRQRGRARSG